MVDVGLITTQPSPQEEGPVRLFMDVLLLIKQTGLLREAAQHKI